MDSFVIWQGNLGEIYEGQTHRIRQIADDNCIVEFSGENGPDDGGWDTEESDWVCADAYMRALLAARGSVYEVWQNGEGVPVCISTPANIEKMKSSFEPDEVPMLSFRATCWEEARVFYQQLQKERWGA